MEKYQITHGIKREEHHSHHVSREEVENLKMKQEIEKSWKNEGVSLQMFRLI